MALRVADGETLAVAAADAATPAREALAETLREAEPLADRERDTAVAVAEVLRDRDALADREDVNERLADGEDNWLLPNVALVEALAAADALGERLATLEGDEERVAVGLKPV